MNEKKTIEISKVTQELAQKTPDISNPIEFVDEFAAQYDKEVMECLNRGKILFPFNDFFIEVQTQALPMFKQVFRWFYCPRLACPTPNYDQIVYKYDRQKDALEFIWTIPDRHTCHMLLKNESYVEEKELLKYVKDFEDKTLFKLMKQLNNEAPDSPEIILFNKE